MQLFRPGSVPSGPTATIDPATLEPGAGGTPAAERTEDLLAAAYAWPVPGADRRPTVRANMVASLDGGATLDGRAGGLGTRVDQRLIGLLRDTAHVVLVGAGTVVTEGYPGVRRYPRRARRRERWDVPGLPGWAIVASRTLPADLPAIADGDEPAIVVSPDGVEQPTTAEVIRTGPTLDLPVALAALAERGAQRILCEGGPTLLGRLVADDLLDELCLTISPVLLGSTTTPMLGGAALPGEPDRWRLVTLLADGDHLFTRYRRNG